MKRHMSSEVSRRKFLGAMGAAGAVVGLGVAPLAQAAPGKKIPVGLQLYSLREQCKTDLPGMLAAVSKIGYRGVEFAGYHGRSAKDLRKMLDDNCLVACGTHTPYDSIQGDKLQETIEFNRTIGNKFLIVPGFAEQYRNSRAAWRKTADIFNGIAAKLAPEGMFTGYHNHTIEFTPMDGELPWDTFFGNTRKEVVMQFDTGNAMHGGGDAVPFLKRYPGRALTLHAKEFSRTNSKAVVGEGDIPWKDVFRLCETIGGTQWYIVEQESYAYPPMECVAKCLQNLKKMGL